MNIGFDVLIGIIFLFLGIMMDEILRLLYRNKEINKKKRREYINLTKIIHEIESYGKEHNFKHKDGWANELETFANENKDWLGDLNMKIKRLSWEIKENNFNHEEERSVLYCHDELGVDLNYLTLLILPKIRRANNLSHIEEKELTKKYINIIQINIMGVGGKFTPYGVEDPQLEKDYKKWKKGDYSFIPSHRNVYHILPNN